jgi:NADPH:quinone reductase-like Zn-dependent oxidoreductase
MLLAYSGGFAEYACAGAQDLVLKPDDMTWSQVAALPQASHIAIQAILEEGKVKPGQEVLINGAGGSAGSFAIQLAKLQNAIVTGVDNAGKLEFMRSLGADHVIDYMREDFTRNGKRYDLVLDVIAHRPAFAYPRALAPNGTYFFVGGSVSTLLQILLFGPLIKRMRGKQLRLLVVQPNPKHLLLMTELIRAGKIVPQIDREYPLRALPDALRYHGAGLAKGKIVITMDG